VLLRALFLVALLSCRVIFSQLRIGNRDWAHWRAPAAGRQMPHVGLRPKISGYKVASQPIV
jgi:hypothetical protein